MQPTSQVVLIVEDDPQLLAAMKRYVEAAGFGVVTACDYQSAMDLAQRTPVHVVCVDLGLPNESGYELCERIRMERALRFVPIVVTGERAFPEDMARAEEAGANAFLKKPFAMRLLRQSLEMLLEGAGESRPPIRRLRTA